MFFFIFPNFHVGSISPISQALRVSPNNPYSVKYCLMLSSHQHFGTFIFIFILNVLLSSHYKYLYDFKKLLWTFLNLYSTFVVCNDFVPHSSGVSWGFSGCPDPPRPRNFFSTLVPGSGNFQLSRLAGLGYGLWSGCWVVVTIIVSLTLSLTLITTLTVILP